MSGDNNALRLRIALGITKGMTQSTLERIAATNTTPEEFFSLSSHELAVRLGIDCASSFKTEAREEALQRAGKEAEFILKHHIAVTLATDPDFPARLRNCDDGPVILFSLGDCPLDALTTFSIVGTRTPTPYGLDFCDKAVEAVSRSIPDAVVVSGLAYGIDAAAHNAALRHGLRTIAVVAHGLDTIYPASHRDLARKIVAEGGAIVTEYPTATSPYKPRFLQRNRIIAALSDLTVVAESDIRGGALSTARHAFEYGREVAALPGRIGDRFSSGCNKIIARGKCRMISDIADVPHLLGGKPAEAVQQSLLPDLPEEQVVIISILRELDRPVSADEILPRVNMTISRLLPILNEMEMDGILLRHPGNRFAIAL